VTRFKVDNDAVRDSASGKNDFSIGALTGAAPKARALWSHITPITPEIGSTGLLSPGNIGDQDQLFFISSAYKVPEMSGERALFASKEPCCCHAFLRGRFVAGSTLTRGIVQIKPKQANEKAAKD
jgi:hypothetical protein